MVSSGERLNLMVSSGESWVIDSYPLVNIQKTMENHNFEWVNQLFLWEFSIVYC